MLCLNFLCSINGWNNPALILVVSHTATARCARICHFLLLASPVHGCLVKYTPGPFKAVLAFPWQKKRAVLTETH